MVTIQDRQSVANLSHQDILQLIPQFEIGSIFIHDHLRNPNGNRREVTIGAVGDKGSGKSSTDAVLATVNNLIAGRPVWSNMHVALDIKIDDDTARKYRLNYGGVAHYESKPLVKDALLRLDEEYQDGCFLIEEINIEYSNVRRFMANTNVDFNEVCQLLRKLNMDLYYNVIDEMFIDPQLRSMTDIFIKTHDTALEQAGLASQKPLGQDFMWRVYPMTGYLMGEEQKYARTHKAIDGMCFHFGDWHGIFPTTQKQQQGIYSISTKEKNKRLLAKLSVESDEELTRVHDKWSWLEKEIRQWRNDGIETLTAGQMSAMLGVTLTRAMRQVLPSFGVNYDNTARAYVLDNYMLT